MYRNPINTYDQIKLACVLKGISRDKERKQDKATEISTTKQIFEYFQLSSRFWVELVGYVLKFVIFTVLRQFNEFFFFRFHVKVKSKFQTLFVPYETSNPLKKPSDLLKHIFWQIKKNRP